MLLFAVLALATIQARAGGLTTRLGEVVIDNVRSGHPFSLRESLNMPLRVTNTSARPVSLKLEVWVNKPGDRDLREGYEPLPDAAWVTLEKEYFPRVEPNADVETDITITVPGGKQYLGKKYQFYAWTKTTGGLSNINVGVMSRFLVTVISADNLAILEGRKKPDRIKANLDFSLMPYEIFVKRIAPGGKYELEEIAASALKVVNPNAAKMKFRISSLTTAEAKTFLKTGYADIPRADVIRFREKEFWVAPESIKRIKAYIQLPKDDRFRGKRFQSIISLEPVGQDVNAKVYARVYITTEE